MEYKTRLKIFKMINVGSDFSDVGAFNQALMRLGIEYNEIFACDMDKYARETFILNYGEPQYFPKDVYEREIPKESLDIYMSSPPCQAFSLAGNRKGEDDKRGILFYNTHEFIQKNRPRFFIIENVKGLLSDDGGKTFQRWIDMLAGKSVNGNPVIFPLEESTPYHVYYQVLNAKHYGVPQNRERIFIIGVRDDVDNNFHFPKPIHLTKRLKDVLESEVDEKYFLGEKTLDYFQRHLEHHKEKGNGFGFKPQTEIDSHANSVTTKYGTRQSDTYLKIGTWRTHEDGRGFRETEDNNCPTIPARAREDGSGQPVIKIGAIRGRNPENPKSRQSGLETEQMLEINENDTSNCLSTVQKDNVVVITEPKILGYTRDSKGIVTARHEKDLSGTIHTSSGGGGNTDQFVIIPTNNSKGYDIAEEEEEDSINFSNLKSETKRGRVGKGVSQTLDTYCQHAIYTQQRIRRLTPLECFRLMDFNEDFKWNVSDSQAYKQAGNSIVVGVLAAIINKLNL